MTTKPFAESDTVLVRAGVWETFVPHVAAE